GEAAIRHKGRYGAGGVLPGGAALAGPGVYGLTGGSRRPDKAKPPSGTKAGMAPVVSSPVALRLPGLGYMGLRGAGDNVIGMQLY
ncbi:hypothetical protein M2F92_28430, partial [Klebsiella pneumoniae]|nr:hypothetical protein [Klebsiella pneumoniae]